MGCAASVYASAAKKKKKNKKNGIVPQATIFVPSIRLPAPSDLHSPLRGLIPNHLSHSISSLRTQISFLAAAQHHHTTSTPPAASAIPELLLALHHYLPLLIGLTHKEYGLQDLVEFKWKNLDDDTLLETHGASNSWYELLSVLHMMALLTLMQTASKLIPTTSTKSAPDQAVCVSPDCMKEAVDLLLTAAGYLDFCIRELFPRLPPHIKNSLPLDLHPSVMKAILNQALAQGTEIQLGLAVGSQNATLSVKRRLACEQLSYYGQAHHCLSKGVNSFRDGKKLLLFIKWKYLQSKAAAYYYHGLILDKGTEPSCHVSAVGCFLAAEELVAESKKACLSFCLADPVTRAPPPWGAMKHLDKKIPEMASKKLEMYGYLLGEEKGLQMLPDLPEFQLSLKPDDYELPMVDPAWDNEKWDIPGQSLKEQLQDSEEEETE